MVDPISRPFAEDQFVEGYQLPPKVAAQPDQLRKARIDEANRKDERERNELAEVLQLEQGQAFVMRLLSRCGVYRATFSNSHAESSFADGQRDIGLWVLEQIQSIDPEMYATLLMHHVHRQRRLASVNPIA
jgi:hypothetical protein